MTDPLSGADALCGALEAAGVECVFGLPGTQTVGLYDSLRRSRMRAVVPTHELAAAFMACGYARASGTAGVLLTIPGPGFAYALPGLAEARLDGAAVVHFTLEPARGPTGAPAFQAIDQAAIAGPLVKAVLPVRDRAALPHIAQQAVRLAQEADPGPVFVEIAERLLTEMANTFGTLAPQSAAPLPAGLDDVVMQVAAALRPVVFIAGECADAADALRRVSADGRMPICVPPPSRGVMAEDHPWCLCFDDQRTEVGTLQAMLAESDLIVLIGTRLGHVATAGFRMALPPERVICVAPRGGVLPHGYRAARTIEADPEPLLDLLAREAHRFASQWTVDHVRAWQRQFADARPADPPEPKIDGVRPQQFFSDLRAALPRDAIVVTDSGLHQVMVRRHLQILASGGLIIPSDFQSMGFGLPAAIGAKLAAPARAVLAIVGDGGFAMSGLEMLTAQREKIPVVVVVFNDGQLNLIRLQQLREFGIAHAVGLDGPDLERFASAVGVRYRRIAGNIGTVIQEALAYGEPTLVEVRVGDSAAIHRVHAVSAVREAVREALGPRIVSWIKRRVR